MTVSTVTAGGKRQVQIESVSPDAQASTAATAVVSGSGLDTGPWKSLAYTIVVATNDVDWSVFGANASDYSDEVAVLAATTVTAGSNSSYSTTQAPFRYYRVKIIDTVPATHGTATVRGIAKG